MEVEEREVNPEELKKYEALIPVLKDKLVAMTKKDLMELKAFKSPPRYIVYIADLYVTMMNGKPPKTNGWA